MGLTILQGDMNDNKERSVVSAGGGGGVSAG